MTIDNYTQMSNQELIDEFNKYKSKNCSHRQLNNKNPTLLNEIINRTLFLDVIFKNRKMNVPILARIYCLIHNIYKYPTCQNERCDNPVNWDRKKSEFFHHCSQKCSANDENVIKERQLTCLKIFGVSHPSKSNEIKQKKINTTLKNYGVENPSQSEEIKRRKEQTCIDHFGVKCALQSDIVKQKTKNTNLIKYQSQYPTQSQYIKDKVKQTCIDRYKVDCTLKDKTIQEKTKNTIRQKYKVEHQSQSQIVKQKKEQTCIEHFGVNNPMKSEDVKEKSKKTCNDRYGCDYYTQTNEFKQKCKITCLLNYGVESATRLDEVKQKSIQTCIERYGVQYYTQSEEYHKKKRHKYHSDRYTELTFDSTWEVKVYEFCKDNNIEVEYNPSISYEYEYDNKTWTYHPDFLINGKLYEIKGDYFFRINESTGNEEMFCPYRYDDWSDEHYNWMCGKYEAKHQCMIRNNVIILRELDISNISKYKFV